MRGGQGVCQAARVVQEEEEHSTELNWLQRANWRAGWRPAQKNRGGGKNNYSRGVIPRSARDVWWRISRASKISYIGEVVGARGASLGGPYGAAVKAHSCVTVDESCSSLAARCVCLSTTLPVCLCLVSDERESRRVHVE